MREENDTLGTDKDTPDDVAPRDKADSAWNLESDNGSAELKVNWFKRSFSFKATYHSLWHWLTGKHKKRGGEL